MKMYQIEIYWMAWYEYMLYDRNTTCVGDLLIWRWRCWFFYIIMCISVFGGIFLLLSKVNYPVPVLDTGPQENWRYQKIL